jgi:hypothetical protein
MPKKQRWMCSMVIPSKQTTTLSLLTAMRKCDFDKDGEYEEKEEKVASISKIPVSGGA